MAKSSSSGHKSSHNSRHARDHSDSEEENYDVNVVKNTASRGSRESRSGEKRKLASVSQNGVDCSGNDNADELEKNSASKKRKVEDLEKSSKSKSSKALSDSKSKSSRRKEENVRLKTESKSKDSKEKHNTELHLQEDLQIRRRDGSVEKDKHQDSIRDSDGQRLSSMGERAKDGRYKDESSRDNSREVHRNSGYRDGKQRVDDKEKRHREGRHRNEHSLTDRPGNRSDAKIRDESNAKKSRSQNSHRDGNLIYDDRSIRCKVDKEKRSHDKEGESDADVDYHNRKRRSPCFSSHIEKDQYRHLKQAEKDYMDSMPEDRVQHNAFYKDFISVSGLRADSSASLPMDKHIHIDYNCYERTCNSNMGRGQGNPWKGVRNLPSPVINGFTTFQHGHHPMGFHPVMQQFSAPPMFGDRPSMELNHSGIPYHIADTERFSSHRPPFGWQNFVDGSHPPHLCHVRDANNGITRDEAHACGRLGFEHNRSSVTSQGWETSVDVWKGQSGGVTEDLPSVPEKKDRLLCAPEDEFLVGQSSGQPSDGLAKEISSKASNSVTERTPNLPKISSRDYDDQRSLVYLSKLDISADLTHPEIYNQCTSIVEKTVDPDSSKFLYQEEVVEARVKVFNNNSTASLFAPINDSVFQRAMSLYKKQREEPRSIFRKNAAVPVPSANEEKMGELAPTCPEKPQIPSNSHEKIDEPVLADSMEDATKCSHLLFSDLSSEAYV